MSCAPAQLYPAVCQPPAHVEDVRTEVERKLETISADIVSKL
jgi:hypothetical protein